MFWKGIINSWDGVWVKEKWERWSFICFWIDWLHLMIKKLIISKSKNKYSVVLIIELILNYITIKQRHLKFKCPIFQLSN